MSAIDFGLVAFVAVVLLTFALLMWDLTFRNTPRSPR
jgi:hypothetical protein